jgi:hypothetical protein
MASASSDEGLVAIVVLRVTAAPHSREPPATAGSVCLRLSHAFAGQLAGLPDPLGELLFVEPLILVNVQVAHGLLL